MMSFYPPDKGGMPKACIYLEEEEEKWYARQDSNL